MRNWDSDGGSTPESSTKFWYAVKVRQRFERMIESALLGKGIETFAPLYTERRRWSDRIKEVEVPLFSGYLFCRIDPEHRMPVLTIPGVQYFVGIGRAPAAVADEEIESLRAVVRSGALFAPRPYLAAGERVRVEEGPLRGAEGILVREKGTDELVVSVSLLQRSVAVTVERDAVVPADGAWRHTRLWEQMGAAGREFPTA